MQSFNFYFMCIYNINVFALKLSLYGVLWDQGSEGCDLFEGFYKFEVCKQDFFYFPLHLFQTLILLYAVNEVPGHNLNIPSQN